LFEDKTFVYCEDSSQNVEEALRLIRGETNNQILLVSDSELAKSLKMKPGYFYCYYKPSFLNGFA